MIRFKVIQNRLFIVAMNRNPSPATSGLTVLWKTSALYYHLLFVIQKSDEFLTFRAWCTASETVKRKFFALVFFTLFKERWFLHMHIEQSAEVYEDEGWKKKKGLTHIEMWPKLPILYIMVDPPAFYL